MRRGLPVPLQLALLTAALVLVLAGLLEKNRHVRDLIPDHAMMLKLGLDDPLITSVMPVSALLTGSEVDGPPPVVRLLAFRGWAAALCFYIAASLGGGIYPGLLAAGGALFYAPEDLEQAVFSCFLLTALALGVRRRGAETAGNAAVAGLALGATFLVRSSAVSFPFIWSAHELCFTRGPLRARAWRAAVLAGCVFVPLLPWAALTWSAAGTPSFFEHGRADTNIVTAVLGSVYTIEGNFREMAGLQPGEGVYGWAARTIAASPLAYLSSVLVRLKHILAQQPWLAAAAAAGTALTRAAAGRFLLPALACGFMFTHSLMSIETRYLEPLWLLLCCAAAPGLARLARGFPVRADWIPAVSSAASACFSVLALAAVTRALLWPVAPGDAFYAARRDPARANPYLLRYGAAHALHAGDHEGLLFFTRAAAAAGLQRALAALASLESGGVFWSLPEDWSHGWLKPKDLHVIKGLRQLELGRDAEARETFAATQARALWLVRGLERGVDRDIAAKAAAADDFRKGAVLEALHYWPPERRLRLLEKLGRALPPTPEETTARARLLLAGGRPREAAAALDSAGTPRTAALAREAVELYAAAGSRRRARELFDAFFAEGRGGAGREVYLLAALQAGRLESALAVLSREGGVWAGAESFDKCRALSAAGGGFALRAALAELAVGLKNAAAASAGCGLAASSGSGETLQLALVLQDAGSPSDAAAVMERLAESEPSRFYDAGVARLLARDHRAAERNFVRFLEKFPGDQKALSGLRAIRGRS